MKTLTLFWILISANAFGADVKVWFSPGGGCEAAIVAEITKATSLVLVQAYNFTSITVGDALASAASRGVMVAQIQDGVAARQKNNQCAKLKAAGGAVFLDRKHAIAHNKILIIDGHTVLTGSYNFSANAEKRNAENLVRITGDIKTAKAYTVNWSNHLAHCVPYEFVLKSPKETK